MAQSSGMVLALAIVFTIAPVIAVVLRAWSRCRKAIGLGPDDYVIFVTMVRSWDSIPFLTDVLG